MFNESFYPTPSEIAERMIAPYREAIKNGAAILDPSAGKGNLLDRCKYAGAHPSNLFAVEIEPELRPILTEKGYRVIGDDFLRYRSHYLFDIIVMNPPFADGEEHLLTAWEILRRGDLVCLLNATSIDNPNTRRRELLAKIIESSQGQVERLGACFKSSERPTGVEVVMVRLQKKGSNDFFDFNSGMKYTERKQPNFQTGEVQLENQVARADFIQALVETYDQIGDAYKDFIQARNKLNFYVNAIKPPYYERELDVSRARAQFSTGDERQKDLAEYNHYLDWVKGAAWQTVFNRTKMRSVLTDKVRKDFEQFQKQQGQAEFTEENIHALFEMLYMNRDANLHRCVEEVFERLCGYAKENKIHWEGWATNDAYKVNQKVIMPYFIHFDIWDKYRRSGRFKLHYGNGEQMNDIDRVMCMITGKPYEEITTMQNALEYRFRNIGEIRPGQDFDNEVESEFFTLRFWKKGTLHMIFRDRYVWQEFNIRAAKGKNWLRK